MEFVYKQKVGLMDVLKDVLKDILKDEDLATIWGECSPLYTHSSFIHRDLAPG